MSDSTTLSDRYFALIDSIVETTLKGNIRSKEQVYQLLVNGITKGTGEVFERALFERIESTKSQLETKVKATRILRALQTIEAEWKRWEKENQTDQAIARSIEQILGSNPNEYLLTFFKLIDPNNSPNLTRDQLKKLGQALLTQTSSETLPELGQGIIDGLNTFAQLEPDLITWIYEQNQSLLGFGSQKNSPWSWWEKKISSPLAKQLFETLNQQTSILQFTEVTYQVELRAWVELMLLLDYLQQGLVNWFDQQPYNAQFGKKLSYSTFLSFAVIWGQLSEGFYRHQKQLQEGCFLLMLQTLRKFARREDFPLYGGIFASFSGDYLQETLNYFDDPLKQVERTQEKAKILTLLGYSQGTLGQYNKAKSFHEEALSIAREASDAITEIANLNHLSRLEVYQKNYNEAINYSQRALILARQVGNRLGEANGLVNLGYSEVFKARELETMETTIYEQAISYLEQGLQIAQRLEDSQSQALAYNSLGIAYVVLAKPTAAITVLEKGTNIALLSGDIYLQGLNFTYLAEAYYSLGNQEKTIVYGAIGMSLLARINSQEWRQAAGLITIVKGKMQHNQFQNLLENNRSNIIKIIGIDGYNSLAELLEKYQ
ncbi:Tetratricopeptide domain protein [Rippkaea orientalis PCC 8801]|uniref:Tetratricopeptide domain protein n=1 Tax=Rippkaea orientalis (strain PCC 8801 / RF-1) TaxID=41431 RepID=B7K385_RIPO1|nr:tetratricopeptide repeat protein [Rippkaea orientalis]ACK64405.1 Tetratricopeptide domain protein [Rippkaea orientalis PCC 8801]